jgi:hypothetical protein
MSAQPPSKFEVLAEAIASALRQAPAVAAKVERPKFRAVAIQDASAIIVGLPSAQVSDQLISGQPLAWQVTVPIECFAKATKDQAAYEVSDALGQAVMQRLAADPTVGGSAIVLVPQGYSNDIDPIGDQSALCTLMFLATVSA